MSGPLDPLCINTVRFLSVGAVQQANSGHPGLPLGARDEAAWNERMAAYTQAFLELAEELRRSLRGEVPPDWDGDIPVFRADAKGIVARVASGKVINAIAPRVTQGWHRYAWETGETRWAWIASARRRRGRPCCANMDSAWRTCANERWPCSKK